MSVAGHWTLFFSLILFLFSLLIRYFRSFSIIDAKIAMVMTDLGSPCVVVSLAPVVY